MLISKPSISFNEFEKKWGVHCNFFAQKIDFWYFPENYHFLTPLAYSDFSEKELSENEIKQMISKIPESMKLIIPNALHSLHQNLTELSMLQNDSQIDFFQSYQYQHSHELHAGFKKSNIRLVLSRRDNQPINFSLHFPTTGLVLTEKTFIHVYPSLISQIKNHPIMRLKVLFN